LQSSRQPGLHAHIRCDLGRSNDTHDERYDGDDQRGYRDTSLPPRCCRRIARCIRSSASNFAGVARDGELLPPYFLFEQSVGTRLFKFVMIALVGHDAHSSGPETPSSIFGLCLIWTRPLWVYLFSIACDVRPLRSAEVSPTRKCSR